MVGEYLDAGEPARDVDLETASEYFVTAVASLSAEDHVAARGRGAAAAAGGRMQLLSTLTHHLAKLEPRLLAEPLPQRIRRSAAWSCLSTPIW